MLAQVATAARSRGAKFKLNAAPGLVLRVSQRSCGERGFAGLTLASVNSCQRCNRDFKPFDEIEEGVCPRNNSGCNAGGRSRILLVPTRWRGKASIWAAADPGQCRRRRAPGR